MRTVLSFMPSVEYSPEGMSRSDMAVAVGAGSGNHEVVLGVQDLDRALGAVHTQPLAGLDGGGSGARAGDGRQAVFAAHDRGVAHHAADVRDRGADLAEDGTP